MAATSIKDITTGVEASVVAVANGKPGKPYPVHSSKPSQGGQKPDKDTGYLEVEAGQNFGIKVVFHRTFAFMRQKGIRITYDIDGDENHICHCMLEKDKKKRDGTREDQLLGFRDNVHGEWKSFGLAFAKSEIVEDATEIPEEKEALDARGRGKIVITIRRGTFVNRTTDEAGTRGGRFLPSTPTTTAKTTKKIATDNGKGFFTECVELGDAPGDAEWIDFQPPPGLKKGARPKKGSVHEEIKFTFFYLSREYLEQKEILPFIPEPVAREDAIVISDDDGDDQLDTGFARSSRNSSVATQPVSRNQNSGESRHYFPGKAPAFSTRSNRKREEMSSTNAHSPRLSQVEQSYQGGQQSGPSRSRSRLQEGQLNIPTASGSDVSHVNGGGRIERRGTIQDPAPSQDDEEFVEDGPEHQIKLEPTGENDAGLQMDYTANGTPQYSQRFSADPPEEPMPPEYEDERNSMYDVTPGYEHGTAFMPPAHDDSGEHYQAEVQESAPPSSNMQGDEQGRRSATRSIKRAASQETERPRGSYSSIDTDRARKEAKLERRILRQEQKVAELQLKELRMRRDQGMFSSDEE
ncbi:hypothetical protein HII31_06546 [Pseudocercospora fuligena]|uniref:DUF7918 domain-containing protein n=1 Tax=Pseudocercospora fuligena TaxID=685502 RepID=A0A8H6VHW5_9PEZI|nr:hypothetical protein HII31_06546 [Pseudocercospora fuligena]